MSSVFLKSKLTKVNVWLGQIEFLFLSFLLLIAMFFFVFFLELIEEMKFYVTLLY